MPSSTSNGKAQPSAKQLRNAGGKYACKMVEKMFLDSAVEDRSDTFPKFALDELQLGKLLGKGGFGTVKEIRSFHIHDASEPTAKNGSKFEPDEVVETESRKFIAQNCIRNNTDARYAIKYLSPEVIADPAMYIQGITDMNVETRFLSSIEHTNIIKMRAIASGPRYVEEYFFLMDRLYDTLDKRILKWSKLIKRGSSLVGKFRDRNGQKSGELFIERLLYAFDLCAAIEYLHDHKIIYRDIKPENIGFDVRNDIKLFDFGLAKEITNIQPDSNGTYKLTEQTGSPRYMAPEVALGNPYNEKCDVYSMTILLHQMISAKPPFQTYTMKTMKNNVYVGGKRPLVDPTWPKAIKLAIARGWTADVKGRPSMKNVSKILHDEIARLRDGDDTGLQHDRRRSTFVFRG
mmetsp:Transcript_21800/g.31296  ORF Transcript_21800/g.31296 Transcript_21800/m.31296 type:complete len:404 (+) Transcript_21800:29-1240(+)